MTPAIPGAQAVAEWFGRWPSFHDDEILSVHINRSGTSAMRLHVRTLKDQPDERGFYVVDREAVIRFELTGIKWLMLQGENRQNVIDGLAFEPTIDGCRIELAPCYGIWGEIVAQHVSVHIEREGPP